MIEEVVLVGEKNGLLKKLLKLVSSPQENLAFIVEDIAKKGLSVKKIAENEYEVLYKGAVLKTGKDFEVGAFLRRYFWKSLHKASNELIDLQNIFEDFLKSVKEFAGDQELAKNSFKFFQNKNWKKLEDLFNEKELNFGWSPNRGGFDIEIEVLETGKLVDRYGGWFDENGIFNDKGFFVSPKGIPFSNRALPKEFMDKPYRIYKVVKPIKLVRKGKIIPWFGEKGLGKQYDLPKDVNTLIKDGYLKLIEK